MTSTSTHTDDTINTGFKCKIAGSVMMDPVIYVGETITVDIVFQTLTLHKGDSFERNRITAALRCYPPYSKLPAAEFDAMLVPNLFLLHAIQATRTEKETAKLADTIDSLLVTRKETYWHEFPICENSVYTDIDAWKVPNHRDRKKDIPPLFNDIRVTDGFNILDHPRLRRIAKARVQWLTNGALRFGVYKKMAEVLQSTSDVDAMRVLTDQEKEKAKSLFYECIDQFDTYSSERWVEETIKLVRNNKTDLLKLPQPPRAIGKSKRDDTEDDGARPHAPTTTVSYGTELGLPHATPITTLSYDDGRPQWAYGK